MSWTADPVQLTAHAPDLWLSLGPPLRFRTNLLRFGSGFLLAGTHLGYRLCAPYIALYQPSSKGRGYL